MKEVYEQLLTDIEKGIPIDCFIGVEIGQYHGMPEMDRFHQVTPTFRILRTVVPSTWLSFVQF